MTKKKSKYIIGISCFYHDSAACLLDDGNLVAAAQEERFTRKKHDPGFPENAINYCLEQAGISIEDVSYIVFYEKPFLTFERLLLSYISVAPRGIRSWLQSMPLWLGEKLHIPKIISKKTKFKGPVLFSEHHESHAASAFYPSPFQDAAILTIDGVGEWATGSYGYGSGNEIKLLKELRFPDSVGLLYSAFTYFTGFKVNSGEYKLMGLAPYGEPVYKKNIFDNLVDLKDDGSIRLDLSYFDFLGGMKMTGPKFSKLFGGPPRKPEDAITKRELDIAASIQAVTEEIVLKMACHVFKETGSKNLCLAGGVALNCVANGKLHKEGPFENIWIQPAAGDCGGAVGAAFSVYHKYLQNPRATLEAKDKLNGLYLGPSFSIKEVRAYLEENKYPYALLEDDTRAFEIASHVANGKTVGYMAGRMEFGPRALGSRSIIGDPTRLETQSTINLKIKYRESFRPFAPSVLEEKLSDYFDIDRPTPYMLMVADVAEHRCIRQTVEPGDTIMDRLHFKRSNIPAVTHVDYSARIQSVNRDTKKDYYGVIEAFEKITGCACIVNTSFNVRGEPIVCTPDDAYRCFMRTQMDVLVIENCILLKEEQPEWNEKAEWKNELVLD